MAPPGCSGEERDPTTPAPPGCSGGNATPRPALSLPAGTRGLWRALGPRLYTSSALSSAARRVADQPWRAPPHATPCGARCAHPGNWRFCGGGPPLRRSWACRNRGTPWMRCGSLRPIANASYTGFSAAPVARPLLRSLASRTTPRSSLTVRISNSRRSASSTPRSPWRGRITRPSRLDPASDRRSRGVGGVRADAGRVAAHLLRLSGPRRHHGAPRGATPTPSWTRLLQSLPGAASPRCPGGPRHPAAG